MTDLTFYTHPWSRGRTVRWMLEECEANYQTEVLEYGTSMKSAEYLAINPMGKVPALSDGDMIVTETAAICAYLADKFPEKQLAPAIDNPERGNYYRWLFFTVGPFEAAVSSKHLDLLASAEQSQMVGYGSYNDVINTLEKTLTGTTYLCGNQFTAADLLLTGYLGWYMQYDLVPKRAVFEEYVGQHFTRPKMAIAQALDDKLQELYPVQS